MSCNVMLPGVCSWYKPNYSKTNQKPISSYLDNVLIQLDTDNLKFNLNWTLYHHSTNRLTTKEYVTWSFTLFSVLFLCHFCCQNNSIQCPALSIHSAIRVSQMLIKIWLKTTQVDTSHSSWLILQYNFHSFTCIFYKIQKGLDEEQI